MALRLALVAIAGWLNCLASAQAGIVPFGELGQLEVCAPNIIRVTRWPTREAKAAGLSSLVARSSWPPTPYHMNQSSEDVTITTSQLKVTFSKQSGNGTFAELSGRPILQEMSHSFQKVTDMGAESHEVQQSWSGLEEGLYGGGSYQNGLVNYKNAPISMIQFNLEAVVPFFVSSAKYGLLWDNYAWTYLNPPDASKALVKPVASKGQTGEVTWRAPVSGDHFFHVGRLMDDGRTPLWGGGHETVVAALAEDGAETMVIEWPKEAANHPSSLTGRLPNVKAGARYTIRFNFDTPGAGLYVQGPDYARTTLRSAYAKAIDYYFVYGSTTDTIISGYRQISGPAPVYGKFAYGFWQCREHYATQEELLEAAREFRVRKIPVDAIVQDWHYWGNLGWGPEWDPAYYPDPASMVKELDALKMKLMVSVWGKMDNKTAMYKAMKPAGMILGDTNKTTDNWYDAWSPSARQKYYDFCNRSHFSIGVESLWLDATEPEGLVNIDQETHLGSGNLLMNSYSLQTTSGIADGLRRDYPGKQGARVFSLTRSSFAGQQRTGAALWTGDTSGTWDMLRRQVASSINFPLSGIPYWSQDIGGFFRPKDQYDSKEYHKLLIRWFHFGVFTPIFRVHGAGTHTELWHFGNETMKTINSSAITLRYRLMPYIYSCFLQADVSDYTVQRGLAFDFSEDLQARSIADEYMFGPTLLVAPIVSPGDDGEATSREVYFPSGEWIHFHTGNTHSGTQTVLFGVDQSPVFARSGSILVLGSAMQFAAEKPVLDLEVRIFPGGDASFDFWEDDGHSSMYQHGSISSIQFKWSEGARVLRISDRKGSFEGMERRKQLCIVFVRTGHGLGVEPSSCDKQVAYVGKGLEVREDALYF